MFADDAPAGAGENVTDEENVHGAGSITNEKGRTTQPHRLDLDPAVHTEGVRRAPLGFSLSGCPAEACSPARSYEPNSGSIRTDRICRPAPASQERPSESKNSTRRPAAVYDPLRHSAISFSGIAALADDPPVGLGDVDGGGPCADAGPPSSTRSTRPSIVPNTSMPLRQVGWPEMFALVEISGWPSHSSSACADAAPATAAAPAARCCR